MTLEEFLEAFRRAYERISTPGHFDLHIAECVWARALLVDQCAFAAADLIDTYLTKQRGLAYSISVEILEQQGGGQPA